MNGYYVGRVSAVNAEKGMAKVAYPPPNETVSEWLPLLAFEYKMPEIGTLVATVLDEHNNGVILGEIYSNAQTPPANTGYKKVNVDGVEIKSSHGTFEIKFNSSNYIRYSDGTLTIRGDNVKIERNCDV